jgi:hypothetical protein
MNLPLIEIYGWYTGGVISAALQKRHWTVLTNNWFFFLGRLCSIAALHEINQEFGL